MKITWYFASDALRQKPRRLGLAKIPLFCCEQFALASQNGTDDHRAFSEEIGEMFLAPLLNFGKSMKIKWVCLNALCIEQLLSDLCFHWE